MTNNVMMETLLMEMDAAPSANPSAEMVYSMDLRNVIMELGTQTLPQMPAA
jgi:hypothetical protein